MILWGLFVMAMAFAANRWGFYAIRFMVGVGEAGFFPGVLFYLTLWFPNSWRARIVSLFAIGVPVSGVIAGPMSGWIMTRLAGLAGLRGWQWLFLIEGAPALLLGVLAYLYLPDRPANARFLTDREKAMIESDLAREAPAGTGGGLVRGRVAQCQGLRARADLFRVLFDAKHIVVVDAHAVAQFRRSRSGRDRRAHVSDLPRRAVGMAAIGWSSDRSMERRWHLIMCGVVASTAFFLLPLAADSPDGTTLILAVAAVTIFAFLALFWTVPTTVLGEGARAGGIALVSSIGASGSALSPAFMGWTKVLTGSLFGAIAILASVFLASMIALYFCAPGRASLQRAAASNRDEAAASGAGSRPGGLAAKRRSAAGPNRNAGKS